MIINKFWILLIVICMMGSLAVFFLKNSHDNKKTNPEFLTKPDTEVLASDANKKTMKIAQAQIDDIIYTDIKGHWAEQDIKIVSALGLIKGKTLMQFDPEDIVTRGEFTSILLRAAKIPEKQYTGIFEDMQIGEAVDWYQNVAQAAYDAGFIPPEMISDRRFKSDVNITHEEMASMAALVYKRVAGGQATANSGLFGNAAPKDDATRAEAAAMLKELYVKMYGDIEIIGTSILKSVMGNGVNLIQNPGFEQDKAITRNPAGWITETDKPNASELVRVKDNYVLRHWSDGSFNVKTYQKFTNLPNGKYIFRVKQQYTGKNSEFSSRFYAAASTGEKSAEPAVTGSVDWGTVEIKDIYVTDGTAEVGMVSKSSSKGWIYADDFEFYQVGDKAIDDGSFELINMDGSLLNWQISGDRSAAVTVPSGRSGGFAQMHAARGADAKVTTSQISRRIPDGIYTLIAFTKSNNSNSYLFARSGSDAEKTAVVNVNEGEWGKTVISGVTVKNNELSIGVTSDLKAGNWTIFDDIELIPGNSEQTSSMQNVLVGIQSGKISNPSFEQGTSNWNMVGDSLSFLLVPSGYSGNYSVMQMSRDKNSKATISQTVSGIKDGYYTLTAYTRSSGSQNICYVFAKNAEGKEKMTSIPVSIDTDWTKVTVRGIQAVGGKLDIGVFSDLNDGQWVIFDNFELEPGEKYDIFLGGDTSRMDEMYSEGAKFYDNGEEKYLPAILGENGYTGVRLRSYVDPGNPNYSPSNLMKPGFQTKEAIIKDAYELKQQGVTQFYVTLHPSDWWSSGSKNDLPHAWNGLEFDALLDELYDYVKDFMEKMVAQGTPPTMVTITNESNGGVLWPFGEVSRYSDPANSPRTANWVNYARALNTVNKAIKDVSPSTKHAIHTHSMSFEEQYPFLLGKYKEYGVKYDVIAISYYPGMNNYSMNKLRDYINWMIDTYDKDVFIAETGFIWTTANADKRPQAYYNNGTAVYYPISPQGQLDYMTALVNMLKGIKGGRALGVSYWDPIFYGSIPNMGATIRAQGNTNENKAYFDFQGNALPVFKAYKYNK